MKIPRCRFTGKRNRSEHLFTMENRSEHLFTMENSYGIGQRERMSLGYCKLVVKD